MYFQSLPIIVVNSRMHARVFPVNPGDHKPTALRRTFQISLKQLEPQKVRVLYLHAPDRSVPFADTLSEMDKMHKEGLLYVSPSMLCSFPALRHF